MDTYGWNSRKLISCKDEGNEASWTDEAFVGKRWGQRECRGIAKWGFEMICWWFWFLKCFDRGIGKSQFLAVAEKHVSISYTTCQNNNAGLWYKKVMRAFWKGVVTVGATTQAQKDTTGVKNLVVEEKGWRNVMANNWWPGKALGWQRRLEKG